MRDEKPEDLRPRTKRFALDVIRLYAKSLSACPLSFPYSAFTCMWA